MVLGALREGAGVHVVHAGVHAAVHGVLAGQAGQAAAVVHPIEAWGEGEGDMMIPFGDPGFGSGEIWHSPEAVSSWARHSSYSA